MKKPRVRIADTPHVIDYSGGDDADEGEVEEHEGEEEHDQERHCREPGASKQPHKSAGGEGVCQPSTSLRWLCDVAFGFAAN